ncbi:MAG: phosphomethylpyrimidine synthase ThiC [Candidatus Pacearchaeota archaeon]|jgi:phosphomethylpyrimidine synthase
MDIITIGNKMNQVRIGVGKDLETKINLIIGANSEEQIENEKEKISIGARLGVHTIIDLSTKRFPYPLWRYGIDNYPNIAFGKVAPILVSVENNGEVTPDKLFKEIQDSVLGGIDYMTMNLVPLRLSDLDKIGKRDILTTSRQGGVLLNYMMKNNVNSPYLPILDDMFNLFKEYNVTMHIGSTFRPNGVTEAYDKTHLWELSEQMRLYKIADEIGMQAIVEPMSHQPLSDIGPGIIRLREEYGSYVPFQMLGPIVTEVNNNCDQYASASGAAFAAMYNVGKITTIPPREHVGFPTLADTEQGIISTLTSVHAGDMCRLDYLKEMDRKITHERNHKRSCNPESSNAGCNKCQSLCPLLIENFYSK